MSSQTPCYVRAALRGTGRHSRHTRLQAIAIGLAALAAAVLLDACGSGSSSDSEPAGTFHVKVSEASFPAKQDLGQTSLLRLGVRNTGRRTIPGLTVTFTVAGKQGVESSLPFAVSEQGAELASSERPVWVLAQGYPRLHGSSGQGGATTSSPKTFDLGELKPGKTAQAVWKLSAVRPGKFTLLYRIDAGLSGKAKAKSAGGVAPGGSLTAEITEALPETEVNGSGEIVPAKRGR